ncbi:MAG: dihydrofolate reductase [Ignavibacteria bacterium]|nr:dihydrofolate reductase [Ignavibacteria bacterium]
MANFVFIATSLDGFIARPDGDIDWLMKIEDIEGEDYGYEDFISKIDAILMGRKTFDFAKSVQPFPYNKPVFVLSNTLTSIDSHLQDKVTIISGTPKDVLGILHNKGYSNIYVDGGETIQSFLRNNFIDELTITRVPVLLGEGIPLFGKISGDLHFQHIETKTFSNGLVSSRYLRILNSE